MDELSWLVRSSFCCAFISQAHTVDPWEEALAVPFQTQPLGLAVDLEPFPVMSLSSVAN